MRCRLLVRTPPRPTPTFLPSPRPRPPRQLAPLVASAPAAPSIRTVRHARTASWLSLKSIATRSPVVLREVPPRTAVAGTAVPFSEPARLSRCAVPSDVLKPAAPTHQTPPTRSSRHPSQAQCPFIPTPFHPLHISFRPTTCTRTLSTTSPPASHSRPLPTRCCAEHAFVPYLPKSFHPASRRVP